MVAMAINHWLFPMTSMVQVRCCVLPLADFPFSSLVGARMQLQIRFGVATACSTDAIV